MKFIFGVVFAITVLASCQGQPKHADLAITHVNIIDPINRKVIPDQHILIQDGKIAEIIEGSQKLHLSDASIIEGTGKYVISGFWDMHAHVTWKADLDETLFPVLLSYGITGVRDMGGDAGILQAFKQQIAQDPTVGPRLFGSGPILDGENPVYPDFSVALTEENVEQKLDSLFQQQVDFFKVYSLLPASVLERVAAYSRQKKIDFAGHVSSYWSPLDAAKLGQKSFEHLNELEALAADSAALGDFVQAVKGNQSWLCPTLIIYKRKMEMAEGKDLHHPLYDVVDDLLKSEWQHAQARRRADTSPAVLDQLKATYTQQKALVVHFYQQGLPILLGTDFGGMAFVYPGYSYHEEMALLAELGFDIYDILKMSTYDPARYLGLAKTHGSIEKGKAADLVLLARNPVEDILHTQDIVAVFREGKEVKRWSIPAVVPE